MEQGEQLAEDELRRLEPYKVKHAVIFAAGIGSRLVPLTYDTPKGLVKVHGVSMTERMITQLLEAGIEDITIMVGHKQQLFRELGKKYKLNFIENPEYATANTISTTYYARHLLENSYVVYADNYYISNPYHAYEYRAWYTVTYLTTENKEWQAVWNEDGLITKMWDSVPGSWCIQGSAYFDAGYARALMPYIEEYATNPDVAGAYWEDIWGDKIDELPMYAEIFRAGEVLEFDTLDELREYDTAYVDNSGSDILEAIAAHLGINEGGITNCVPLQKQIGHEAFTFEAGGRGYAYYLHDADKGGTQVGSGYLAAL